MPANKWDGDGATGPSSMELLVRWMSRDGNSARWRKAAKTKVRATLVCEIYNFLVEHGITHRTLRGIKCKLWMAKKRIGKADEWLEGKGGVNLLNNNGVRRVVLQLCPEYFEMAPFLRPNRSRDAKIKVISSKARRIKPRKEFARRERNPGADRVSRVGPRRADADGIRARPASKRVRTEYHTGQTSRVHVAMVEADPHTRREFFRLELQVKHDHAICVRVKARKELLDLDIALHDVDRLLPL